MAKDGAHSHHHHSHAHAADRGRLDTLGAALFRYDPLSNAVLAVVTLTAVTQLLIALSPPLSGSALSFLVAFAEGGMLATVFVHLLPEIEFTRASGAVLIGGFLAFVALDKAFRVLGASAGPAEPHAHAHSHSHSHSHSHASALADPSAAASSELRQRRPKQAGVQEVPEAAAPVTAPAPAPAPAPAATTAGEPVNLSPWLNVVADSLHNVTDGLSLAISFRSGPATGLAAFLVMCCHEIPHQFGDFALLINTGTTKPTARRAQLVTALGTVGGCVLGGWWGALSPTVEELVTPLTAGVFLYVATVGVLPELLETDPQQPLLANARTGAVQLAGVCSGIALLALLD